MLRPKGYFKRKSYEKKLAELEDQMMQHLRDAAKPIYQKIYSDYRSIISTDTRNFDGSQIEQEFCDCIAVLNMALGACRNPLRFLEVGAYKGLWALAFLAICKHHEREMDYVTVTWMESDQNNAPLLKVGDYCRSQGAKFTLINENSTLDSTRQRLARECGDSFTLTFIDGDHAYKSVMKDIALYGDTAEEVLMFHDINTQSCGVPDAIRDAKVVLDKKIMGIGIHFVR